MRLQSEPQPSKNPMSHLRKNPSNNLKPNTAGNASNTKNPTIYNINNTLVCWAKGLVDQASEVPRIFFSQFLIDLGHSKLFIFIFVILEKRLKKNN